MHNHCVQDCLQPKASNRKEWAMKHCTVPYGQGPGGTVTQCTVQCDLLDLEVSSKTK